MGVNSSRHRTAAAVAGVVVAVENVGVGVVAYVVAGVSSAAAVYADVDADAVAPGPAPGTATESAAATGPGRSTFSAGAVAAGRPRGAGRSSLEEERMRHSAGRELDDIGKYGRRWGSGSSWCRVRVRNVVSVEEGSRNGFEEGTCRRQCAKGKSRSGVWMLSGIWNWRITGDWTQGPVRWLVPLD